MPRELLAALTAFNGAVKAGHTVNVNDQASKDKAIALASDYFVEVRPRMVKAFGEEARFARLDEGWQDLVRLAHSNSKRKSYLKVLKALLSELRELSVSTLVRADQSKVSGGLSDMPPDERALIATLEALIPTAAASYRQGVLDLKDANRVSYRGTASEFREALRETLDHLAPDAEVEKQVGYKHEVGQTKPTMKQKTRFVLISRGRSKAQAGVAEKAIGFVEGLAGEVLRATYDRASLATHVETTRAEVLRIKRYGDALLHELLEVPSRPA